MVAHFAVEVEVHLERARYRWWHVLRGGSGSVASTEIDETTACDGGRGRHGRRGRARAGRGRGRPRWDAPPGALSASGADRPAARARRRRQGARRRRGRRGRWRGPGGDRRTGRTV